MKIHHNIIAAIILGLSIIICTIVYVKAQQQCENGRYTYRDDFDSTLGIGETMIFDTAKGILYKQTISTRPPNRINSVTSPDDIELATLNQNNLRTN